MSIRVAIEHATTYLYDKPVSLSPHVIRLRPAVHCRTPIEAYSLKILPENHFINWQQDPFGNFLARDEELIAGDVRLTMGGEPTFVSVDDMESPQWNTEADGAHKQQLARALIKRLHNVFATGGALHYGQGKWYPGEPLPRWRLSCLWRKDGIPLWQNPELLADDTRDYGFGPEQAERFIRHLAQHLGVDPLLAVEGYEDTLYYLSKEGQLPINIDPLKYNLKDSDERRILAKLLDRGLGSPVGYALPLKWSDKSHAWDSSKWQFRRGRMYLIPGDSPMGLRLPLDSLPWVEPHKRQTPVEQSLFQPLPELGDYYGEVARRFSSVVPESKPYPEIQEQEPADEETSVEISHTAICVEPRNGRLYVFFPPLTYLEHFLDLTASVESSASALNMPVVLEGYEPPYDFRIHRLLVTPDPGVIEVNIHPASNWEELVKNTVTLYNEAHLARLGTEKFMLDGRHSGTGGGNHVTIGGPTPADSPILRRPYLLQSLITFWQHHPGLSYLFSGLFIGPTSQSPRIDEARNESLYELEIAFQQMPTGESPNPWLVDRLLRHLLVDLTGNTHRAEFCIDKLYSPETSTGRLGLVELRAFEMPPHARMSLVQMLLLRSLIAWFWKQPYRHSLVRWGTELHDRFMLPHYTMTDMKEVIQGIQAAGFPFQEKWLEPFFEFRFPFYGKVNIKDIELELRMAVEPWHVLGIDDVIALAKAGFDYTFNSSKWWNFEEPWCLQQYKQSSPWAPSVSFPESHDSVRLMEELNGNVSAVKMRYTFASVFSTGLMMPVGFEYGFRKQFNVVHTMPEDWETTNTDLSFFITKVNEIKAGHQVLNEDNTIQVVNSGNNRVFSFMKTSHNGTEKALIIINKSFTTQERFFTSDLRKLFGIEGRVSDISAANRMDFIPNNFEYLLPPCEVRILYCKSY